MDVRDFVTVEQVAEGSWSVFCFRQEGRAQFVSNHDNRDDAAKVRDAIRIALRTWDGWDGDIK